MFPCLNCIFKGPAAEVERGLEKGGGVGGGGVSVLSPDPRLFSFSFF